MNASVAKMIVLISVTSLLGCTTLERVELYNGAGATTGNAFSRIGPGDYVEVRISSGSLLAMTVKEVRENALLGINYASGEDLQLTAEEIVSLDVRRPAPQKTRAIIVGSILGAIFLFALFVTAARKGPLP